MEDKLHLKWNNYKENTIKTFSLLRREEEFFDVTLVSDDQKQIMANKVVLSSSSEYFKNILKTNKHSHPMLCLTGLSSEDLDNVLDYIYLGEVQIFQRDIDKFLDIAQKLRLQGLLTSKKATDEKNFDNLPKQSMETESKLEPEQTLALEESNEVINDWNSGAAEKYASMKSTSVDELEKKIAEYLGKNENGEYICNLCGKVGGRNASNMKKHIEIHMDGISFSCTICGKQLKSRNLLSNHKSRFHKIQNKYD